MSFAASKTADGVGMETSVIISRTAPMPLASVMRLMKSSRIFSFTGSRFSRPNSGMTFFV